MLDGNRLTPTPDLTTRCRLQARLAIAFTPEPQLAPAVSATFHITSLHVKFAFDHGAVVTWLCIRATVFLFLSISDAQDVDAVHFDGCLKLRLSNLVRPIRSHAHASIDDPFARHLQSPLSV